MANTENYPQQSIIHDQYILRSWCVIRNGLNIKGLCTNRQCPAFDQQVIINLGIGEFDFARIILERKNKCPECHNLILPTKYALLNCQWRYVQHYTLQEFPLNTVHFIYQWKHLPYGYIIIETMSLPIVNGTRSIVQECPICLNDIYINNHNEMSRLDCSHIFHRICINQWLHSRQSMANQCPICRLDVVEQY